MKKYTNIEVFFTKEELDTLKKAQSILSEIISGVDSTYGITKDEKAVCEVSELEEAMSILENLIS